MSPSPARPNRRRPPPKSPLVPILLGLGGLLVVGGGIAVALSSSGTPPPRVQPAPTPVDPFSAARQRGLEAMNRAREAGTTDFDAKRRGYDEAIQAFDAALAAAPTDQQKQEIRSFLFECHKSRPLGK